MRLERPLPGVADGISGFTGEDDGVVASGCGGREGVIGEGSTEEPVQTKQGDIRH